jgi:hypothetical protein
VSLLKVNNVTDLGNDAVITDGALVGAGKILQVVQTIKTNVYTVSLGSGALDTVNVTGLDCSITPSSASNKLLVMGSISISGAGERAGYRLMRDGSQSTYVGDAAGSRNRLTGYGRSIDAGAASASFIFLDNATSTSATTYGIRLHNGGDQTLVTRINEPDAATDSARFGRFVSSITIMEVAA